jgi:hypothetical protein
VMDRRRQLVTEDSTQARRARSGGQGGQDRDARLPTAGYRMLGPIAAYDPRTRTFTSRWNAGSRYTLPIAPPPSCGWPRRKKAPCRS